jgi:beta-phosphoglucomutase-like phosphatase (HAD superfamily)
MSDNLWQDMVEGTGQFLSGLLGNNRPMAVPTARLPIRAVLTDFDDVIGDNDGIIHKAYEKLRAELAGKIDLPDFTIAKDYKNNPKGFMDRELEDLSHREKTLVYTLGRHIYEATPMEYLDGAQSTMALYHDLNLPWAIVSNNHMTNKRWQELGLDQRYPNVPVFDNAKKPSEKSLVAALERLSQPAGSDIIMVDDSWKGLFAAAKLGLTPVYIGDKPHLVVPIVEQECRMQHIPVPQIAIVRNNTELQQLVANGLDVSPRQASLQRS